jgi:alpha-1,6-mannosyltransferase
MWSGQRRPLLLGCFFLLGGILLIQWADSKLSTRQLIGAGMLLRLVYLVAMPALSEDAFRYLWDGHLSLQGISPYAFPPIERMDAGPDGLYALLNSTPYRSIYPPVLQGVFAVAAKVGGDSILGGIIALRILVLAAEACTMLLIAKLLSTWKMEGRNLMLYALNPLVIVEYAGNLHGEAFMLPLLLGTLLLFSQQRWMWAVLPFAGAVGVKLLPLMFLPFLPKRMGWGKSIAFGVGTLALVAWMYLPFWTPTLVTDTLATLRLYLPASSSTGRSITCSAKWAIGGRATTSSAQRPCGCRVWWRPSSSSSPFATATAAVAGLPRQWMWAWAVYYFFATTVNPWYVAVLMVFVPFVRYRFALVWVLLLPLSYHAFTTEGVNESLWLVAAQYLPVYLWLGLETGIFKRWEQGWALRRAEVKRKRLLPLYVEKENILEVGSGNGAVTKLLRNAGQRVTPLDIADRSIFPNTNVVLYDGERFPFTDKEFTTCQLITMLHHTPDPEHLVREAMRVADRIIIMEDIYTDPFQKQLTFIADSIVNWEFFGHPHTNRTDAQWRATFDHLGLSVEFARGIPLSGRVPAGDVCIAAQRPHCLKNLFQIGLNGTGDVVRGQVIRIGTKWILDLLRNELQTGQHIEHRNRDQNGGIAEIGDDAERQ